MNNCGHDHTGEPLQGLTCEAVDTLKAIVGTQLPIAVVILGELAVRTIRYMCFTIEGKKKQEADKKQKDTSLAMVALVENLKVHVLEQLVDRFRNAHMLNCMAAFYLTLCRLREHLPKEIRTTVCLFDWTSVQTHARDQFRKYESELDRIAPDKLHELRSQGLVEFDSSLGRVMQPDFPMMPAASRRRS
jgi:hypothetical protein